MSGLRSHGKHDRQVPLGRASVLKKLHEYLRHAEECREMARVAIPTHRLQLIQMAETWEQLAAARKRQLEKDGKHNEDDE